MPALNEQSSGIVLSHVNTMVQALILNLPPEDLRSIVHSFLATSPPSAATTFRAAARSHFTRKNTASMIPDPWRLFVEMDEGNWAPADEFTVVTHNIRALYGAGMGVASLRILTAVVKGVSRTRWVEDSRLDDLLPFIDSDIIQAVQSAREELGAGRVGDKDELEDVKEVLLAELEACEAVVKEWKGDFPFERAMATVEEWEPSKAFGK